MAHQPNAFSNELEQWVCKNFMSSIVCVEFRPDPIRVRKLWNQVDPIVGRAVAERVRQRERDSRATRCATGFVVGEDHMYVYVLTCAHVLGPVFSAERPISVAVIEQVFQSHIFCDHREQKFLRREEYPRIFARARVTEVSCKSDLLLLVVPKAYFQIHCRHKHPPLVIADTFPSPLQRVVLLSWPPLRNRTAVVGEASHPGREYDDVSKGNPKGFTMMLAEVDVLSEEGSSGAPLLNGAGECVAVLHGGFGRLSYFIALDAVREALFQWGIIEGKVSEEGSEGGSEEAWV